MCSCFVGVLGGVRFLAFWRPGQTPGAESVGCLHGKFLRRHSHRYCHPPPEFSFSPAVVAYNRTGTKGHAATKAVVARPDAQHPNLIPTADGEMITRIARSPGKDGPSLMEVLTSTS